MYRVENISKDFEEIKVLEDISIDFVEGGTTCILGPSGCDKPSRIKRVIQNMYLLEANEENMVKMKMMLEREF
ncbi:MAG: hypothetical protein NUK57_02560 [Gudongella sp.]|nr:hypothetical protein [Gudongella sp.]